MPLVKLRRAMSVFGLALIAVGCAHVPTPAKSKFERQLDVTTQVTPAGMDPIATAAFWGTRYDRAPTDPAVAVNFSKSLRGIGNNAESLRVMQHAHSRIGEDPVILLELGKALISNDRPHSPNVSHPTLKQPSLDHGL